MIGIYKITCKKNNKSYIGQSINIEHRIKEHKSCEGESLIHNAIKKYGIENFTFEVLEECSLSQLDEKECYWINFFDSYNNGYNLTKGGQGFQNQISVDCFDFSGKRIAIYPSITAAEEATGASQVSRCINGYRKQSGGFQWRKHVDQNNQIKPYIRNTALSQPISQYNKDKEWVADFNSISEATRKVYNTDNGSLRRRIKKACEENFGLADGFLWCYLVKSERSEVARMADLLD